MVRVGPYHSLLGQLVRAYKYHDEGRLEPVLGRWLADAVQSACWRERVEAVVSVPAHWRRQLLRASYPADALATIIARRTSLPRVSLLRRIKAGPHQIGLSYREREKNVRGAFALRPGVKLGDARLLLVDDVRTTGATLGECAKVLRRAGAKEVYAAVVVRVRFSYADRVPAAPI